MVETFDDALKVARFSSERDGQRRVFDAFRAGRHVILNAPTGWGKTFAVLAALSQKHAIYSLPLRVLVDSLVDDANKFKLRRCVAHHGARKEHAFLDKGDDLDNPIECVFTTLDQSLSAFLGIPIGVSMRQGNILPAVIDASHLVFDEFHLFDATRSWTTALFALQKSKHNGIILTATLSDVMVDFLVETLCNTTCGVELIQGKRPFHNLKKLKKGEGFDKVEGILLGNKTIIIRNQIQWAKDTATLLREKKAKGELPSNCEIYLLHSELLPDHRNSIEEDVRRTFSKNADQPVILVATQVVEAGIDITCDVMHTDLCPPSSFIQRAGRCARYEREDGTIIWHEVEKFTPYQYAEKEIILLRSYLKNTNHLTEKAEKNIVNLTQQLDKKVVEDFKKVNHSRVDEVRVTRDYGEYSRMIRDINNINVAIGYSIEKSYHYLSLSRGKFYGTYSNINSIPVKIEYDVNQRRKVRNAIESVHGADFILLSPEQVGYYPDYGLSTDRLGGEEHFIDLSTKTRTEHEYNQPAEPYRLHIERLYDQRPVCRWIVDAMSAHLGNSQYAECLADFVVWAHDIGKLSIEWQRAHGVEEHKHQPVAHSGKDFPRVSKPPPHAWVSAWSVANFLWNRLLKNRPRLCRPVFWAIADHHGYSSDMKRDSMKPFRLGFLDHLDEMSKESPWRQWGWDSTILTTEVHEQSLSEIYSTIQKEKLRPSDDINVYYALSYILRKSDQLATRLVSSEVKASVLPTPNTINRMI